MRFFSRAIPSFVVAGVIATTLTAVPMSAAAVTAAPTPVVQGNHLVDSRTNTTFVPRGVNIPGLEYSCVQGWRQLPEAGEYAAMTSWKINTVRLPLNESCWLGLDGAPSGRTVAQYQADVKTWVDGLTAAGMVVILDLHWNAPAGYTASGQRAMPDERSASFWSSVATTYAANKSVLFELFNEPYSRSGFTLTWDCWKNGGCLAPVENDETGTLSGAKYTVTGMQTLVTTVRTAGATQPLLLGGLNYSNDLTGWIANKPTDPLNQLVVAWHNYPGQGCSTSCWNSTVTTVAASVPIVTTEFGNTAETTSTAAGNSGNYLVPFMTWADAHGIGYLPWAWWDVGAAEAAGNGSDIYALFTGSSFTPKAPSGTKFHDYLAALSSTPLALTPGTLVKSSTSPTIYLVDGGTNLVPLGAMSSATDAGISSTFVTVPASALDAFAVASAALSNVLSCPGANYVAAESKVWPVDPTLVAGLPKTSLQAATCAALTKSTTTISGALFLTATTGGTIYAISAVGAKRTVLTMETLGALSAPASPVYLHVGAYFLNGIPVGTTVLAPGRLVKSAASPTIYLADGVDKLVPIAAFSTATDAGINPAYFTVAPQDLAGLPVASDPLTQVITCGSSTFFSGSAMTWPVSAPLVAGLPGTTLTVSTCGVLPRATQSISSALLVKSPSTATIYSISTTGTRSAVPTWADVVNMSLPGPPIYVTVGDSFVNARPFGADPVSAGMLVKSQTGPTVYIADSATSLIPLRSFDSVAELGLPTPYSTVSDATIATMTTAPAPLSNLIHCGSDTLLGTQGGAQVVDPVALGTLSVTSPNTALCALIAHGTADTSPLLVKSPSAATIYLIDGGLKRPIASGATFLALSGGTYYTVNGAYLATVPTGTTLP